MKPVVTWIVLANSRNANVMACNGPGKGLEVLDGREWQAEAATEYSDRAGIGHSSAGPGVAAVEQGDPQHQADLKFAKVIAQDLEAALSLNEFDRLVITAAPHMLGLIRQVLGKPLQSVLVAELAKDLSAQSTERIEAQLKDIIAF